VALFVAAGRKYTEFVMECQPQPHTHSPAEVARALGATERWVIQKARSGEIPARKIAGKWRFTDRDIEAVIESSTATTEYIDIVPTPGSRRW
jgi:hypothetical protein